MSSKFITISLMAGTLFMSTSLVSTHSFADSVNYGDAKHAAAQTAPAKNAPAHAPKGGHDIHWGYSGEEGPDNWAGLKPDFKACHIGRYQSPIDITETIEAGLPVLKTDYKDVPLSVVNNGHTIQINYPPGSTLTVDGKTFNLLQFHFHTPSEYAINGKRADMEIHLVHKTDAGELGVIGIMVNKGEENPLARTIWSHLPWKAGERKDYPDVKINVADFLPQDRTYYRLMGSLTTPPCSENVHWHVLKEPIEFSENQIEAFQSVFPMNARPLQEKNNRLIVLDR